MSNIFFDKLTYELQRQKITGNKLCQILGIPNANYSNWKKGIPKAEIISRIADELHVTTDYLLGRSGTDPELPEDEQRLLNNYRKASAERKQIIQDIAEGAAEPGQRKDSESA